MIAINKNFKYGYVNVGSEKTPVVIIDDFLVNTAEVISSALAQNFQSVEKDVFYPGIRAPVGGEYGNLLLRTIAPVFYKLYKVPAALDLIPLDGTFSLLTQQEKDLDLRQCMPHFDNIETNHFAILHYLNEGDFGGTAFYRHKPSGFENITANRKQAYLEAAQHFVDMHGSPQQKYCSNSTNHFELIEAIHYKSNRIVIYPTSIFHSPYITDPSKNINSNPQTGRLTANFFVAFEGKVSTSSAQ